ncbi:MAG TPA: alpha/beta fold hydrolase [Rhodanobacteraceae bacterium]|nr:alpha/beta fold hydrolase [Rhodanobacteraceae bacterium]
MKTTNERPLWQRLVLRRLKMLAILIAIVVVVGGGIYFAAPQWLMRANTWRMAEAAGLSTHTLQVGNTRWTYDEGGKGPTIVLLHGYDMDRNVWLKVAGPLAKNFHLIIPDLPGWGESTRIKGADYGVEAQAKRLAAFLHTLGLNHPMLVGHSMGGAIAGYYASVHPDRVGSLVLMDSLGLSFKENDFAKQALAGHNPFLIDNRKDYARMAKLVFDHPPDLPGRFVDALVAKNKANRAFLERVFNRLRQPGEYDVLDGRLSRLTVPVLGIWCHDDRVIDPSALDTLRNGLTAAPSISVTVINGCGHVPQIEKPEATVRILSGFAITH